MNKSCCKVAYKLRGTKCPVCNTVLVTSNMVVQLAPSGSEGPALAITIDTPKNGTVLVSLDARFYKADGKDDGIREVPLETVIPVELSKPVELAESSLMFGPDQE